MQVARRSVVAFAVIIGLAVALAVVSLRLRAVEEQHAALATSTRQICQVRLWELDSLLPPYRRTDHRNWSEVEQRLIDAQIFDLCLGLDFWISTSEAEMCWIFHADDPRSRHCFDALFDGLYFVWRFRFGNGL